MSLRVVVKEQILVFCVGLNPALQGGVLNKFKVGLGAEKLGLVLQKQLLEVSIVENIGVLVPTCVGTLFVFTAETDGE